MNQDLIVNAVVRFEKYASDKGFAGQFIYLSSVRDSDPESRHFDWMIEYHELCEMEDQPNFGLRKEDFTKFAAQHIRLELKELNEEGIERTVGRWVNRNFNNNETIANVIWRSELGKAKRKLDLLISELRALSDEHEYLVFNYDIDIAF